MTAQQPAAPTSQGQPPKKGSNVLMWILLGCGGIVFLAFLVVFLAGFIFYRAAKSTGITDTELAEKNPALYSAQIMVKSDPDLEFISIDRDNGTITFKNKKSGKTTTWNAKDIADGKYSVETTDTHGLTERTEINAESEGQGSITVKTDKGVSTWGGSVKAPAWLPIYTGAKGLTGGTQKDDTGERGAYTLKTSDSLEQVITFYKDVFKKAGIEYQESTVLNEGTKMIMLVSKDNNGARTASATATTADGETLVQLIYEEKQQ